jgi:hypothetical protein
MLSFGALGQVEPLPRGFLELPFGPGIRRSSSSLGTLFGAEAIFFGLCTHGSSGGQVEYVENPAIRDGVSSLNFGLGHIGRA